MFYVNSSLNFLLPKKNNLKTNKNLKAPYCHNLFTVTFEGDKYILYMIWQFLKLYTFTYFQVHNRKKYKQFTFDRISLV